MLRFGFNRPRLLAQSSTSIRSRRISKCQYSWSGLRIIIWARQVNGSDNIIHPHTMLLQRILRSGNSSWRPLSECAICVCIYGSLGCRGTCTFCAKEKLTRLQYSHDHHTHPSYARDDMSMKCPSSHITMTFPNMASRVSSAKTRTILHGPNTKH